MPAPAPEWSVSGGRVGAEKFRPLPLVFESELGLRLVDALGPVEQRVRRLEVLMPDLHAVVDRELARADEPVLEEPAPLPPAEHRFKLRPPAERADPWRAFEGAPVDLPPVAKSGPAPNGRVLHSLSRAAVVEALTRHVGNRVRAAAELGVARDTLQRFIDRNGIAIPPAPPGRPPKSREAAHELRAPEGDVLRLEVAVGEERPPTPLEERTKMARRYPYNGRELTVGELAALPESSITAAAMGMRLKKGWTVEAAVTTPSGEKRPEATVPVSAPRSRSKKKQTPRKPPPVASSAPPLAGEVGDVMRALDPLELLTRLGVRFEPLGVYPRGRAVLLLEEPPAA